MRVASRPPTRRTWSRSTGRASSSRRSSRESPTRPARRLAPPAIPGAAIGLETVDISRGDVDLLDDPGAPELEQDGSVTIPRGPTDEHLDNTEVGVEQSWTLHQAPGGDGDLVVRIEVDGTQGYVTTTDSGLHFEDPISGLGVSYGVATWIDAEGDETTVMPSFEDGHIVIRIPDEVVDASAFPVLLDPVISAENGIDNPVLAGGGGHSARPGGRLRRQPIPRRVDGRATGREQLCHLRGSSLR
jgi:hypothetical protein